MELANATHVVYYVEKDACLQTPLACSEGPRTVSFLVERGE